MPRGLDGRDRGGAPRQVKQAKGPWGIVPGSDELHLRRLRPHAAAGGRSAAGRLRICGSAFHGRRSHRRRSISPDNIANVREVKADSNGMVRIRFDETSHHEVAVAGRLDDATIQRLILAGSRDEDAAVRVESVSLLKGRVDRPEVLDSLLNALSNDPNDGVRLRALDAVKSMAGDQRVAKTLSQVLLTDVNPAMRMQVIDLMVSRRDDSLVGALQNLMEREDNNGVRLKASKVLKDWNASIGTF
ncbi:MAG: HEAT repeat domain-containing protein [Ignavibacteriota bacterium]